MQKNPNQTPQKTLAEKTNTNDISEAGEIAWVEIFLVNYCQPSIK